MGMKKLKSATKVIAILFSINIFANTQISENYQDGYFLGDNKVDSNYFNKEGFYRDNINDIVLDINNSLMWQDNIDAKTIKKDWYEATDYCNDLSFGGFNDWKLPSLTELKSIVDTNNNPTIKSEFKNVEYATYWSSTIDAGYSNYAWKVNFSNGNQNSNYSKSNDYYVDYYVRCVRAGEYFVPLSLLVFTNSEYSIDNIDSNITIKESPQNGELKFLDGNLSYIPTKDYIGADSFTLEIDGIEQEIDVNVSTLNIDRFYIDSNITLLNNGDIFKVTIKDKQSDYTKVVVPDIKFLSDSDGITINKYGDITTTKSKNYSVLLSVGELKLITSFSTVSKYITKKEIYSESYSSNPFGIEPKYRYSDKLNKLNGFSDKTRWYKFENIDSNKTYTFIYNPLLIETNGDSEIEYRLYKDDGNKKLIGSKKFNPKDGFNLRLAFEKGVDYYIEFKSDSNLFKAEYEIFLIPTEKIKFNGFNGIYKKGVKEFEFIVAKNGDYDVFVSPNIEYKIDGKDISGIHYFNKGIYKLTSNSEDEVSFSAVYLDTQKERESNDNLVDAQRLEDGLKLTIDGDDKDTFVLNTTTTKLNGIIKTENNISSGNYFDIWLYNGNGKMKGYTYFESNGSNEYNFNFDTYPLNANQTYFLQFDSLNDIDINYTIKLNNYSEYYTLEEQSLINLLNDDSLVLDEHLNFSKVDTKGNLIILTGDSNDITDGLYLGAQKLSLTAYQRFSMRGFTDDDIFWINYNKDIDDGVDSSEITVNNFLGTISNWATSQNTTAPLYIYMVDHGSNGAFQIKTDEILFATDLKTTLDKFVADTKREVVVIIEACNSGSFVPILTKDSDKISVITSSQYSQNSYIDPSGKIAFSSVFLDELLAGNSLDNAFNNSKNKLPTLGDIYTKQIPQKYLSKNMEQNCINGCFASANMNLSTIKSLTINGDDDINQTIDLTSTNDIELDVKLNAADAIKTVWGVILPPNYKAPAVGDFITPDLSGYTIELIYDKDSDSYQGSYKIDGDTYDGNYSISVYAEDQNGYVANLSNIYKGKGVTKIIKGSKILKIKAGWNLVSLPTISNLNGNNIKIKFGDVISVWRYNNGWFAYSSDSALETKLINSSDIKSMDSLSNGEGFWVHSVTDKNITFEDNGDYEINLTNLNSGWNLVGATSFNDMSKFNKFGIVWAYDEDWKVYSNIEYFKNNFDLNFVDSFRDNSGVWIYK